MTDRAAQPGQGTGRAAPRRSISGPWVVLGAGVLVLAAISVFIVAATSQPHGVSVPTASGLPSAPAGPLLSPIVTPGAPPADVTGGLVVPRGSTAASYLNQDTPEGQYDRSANLSVPYPADQVVAFFTARLRTLGWRVASVTVTRDGRGRQIIAERLARDGFTWDAGVTVDPLTGGRSRVALRLFQRSEI